MHHGAMGRPAESQTHTALIAIATLESSLNVPYHCYMKTVLAISNSNARALLNCNCCCWGPTDPPPLWTSTYVPSGAVYI